MLRNGGVNPLIVRLGEVIATGYRPWLQRRGRVAGEASGGLVILGKGALVDFGRFIDSDNVLFLA